MLCCDGIVELATWNGRDALRPTYEHLGYPEGNRCTGQGSHEGFSGHGTARATSQLRWKARRAKNPTYLAAYVAYESTMYELAET